MTLKCDFVTTCLFYVIVLNPIQAGLNPLPIIMPWAQLFLEVEGSSRPELVGRRLRPALHT